MRYNNLKILSSFGVSIAAVFASLMERQTFSDDMFESNSIRYVLLNPISIGEPWKDSKESISSADVE